MVFKERFGVEMSLCNVVVRNKEIFGEQPPLPNTVVEIVKNQRFGEQSLFHNIAVIKETN